jgi:hypothetical protein
MPASPVVGYNNNVRHRGRIFHIQTEDSGVKHPHIITHLFVDGGRIIHSVKTSYAEHLGSADLSERVRAMMKEQHKRMFLALREGTYDAQVEHAASANARPSTREVAAPFAPSDDRVSGELAPGQLHSLQPTESVSSHLFGRDSVSAIVPAIVGDRNGEDVTLPPARNVSWQPVYAVSQPLLGGGQAEHVNGASTSAMITVPSKAMPTPSALSALSLSLRQTELAGLFMSELPASSAPVRGTVDAPSTEVATVVDAAADAQVVAKPRASAASLRAANLFADPAPTCIGQVAEHASLELLRYLLAPLRDGR